MVMALFCFTVARARAMFAELLVWFAEPARSCAPHFDGAHFSSMGLSDTGPFKVWAEAAAATASRIAARTAERTTQCLMDISFSAGVSGREISCGFTAAAPGGGLRGHLRALHCIVSHPLVANTTSEFTMDAMPRARSVAPEAMSFSSRTPSASRSDRIRQTSPSPWPSRHLHAQAMSARVYSRPPRPRAAHPLDLARRRAIFERAKEEVRMVDHIGKMHFRRMDEGTDADFAVLARVHQEAIRKLPDQLMGILTGLKADEAYPVDRLQHSLQTATRALRDGRDEEYVVCALLHDIGDTLGSYNHPDIAAAILKPFVSEANLWMVGHHGIFQGYYFFHHIGMDRNMRDQFRDHPHYPRTEEFCALYDGPAF